MTKRCECVSLHVPMVSGSSGQNRRSPKFLVVVFVDCMVAELEDASRCCWEVPWGESPMPSPGKSETLGFAGRSIGKGKSAVERCQVECDCAFLKDLVSFPQLILFS